MCGFDNRGIWVNSLLLDVSPPCVCGIFRSVLPLSQMNNPDQTKEDRADDVPRCVIHSSSRKAPLKYKRDLCKFRNWKCEPGASIVLEKCSKILLFQLYIGVNNIWSYRVRSERMLYSGASPLPCGSWRCCLVRVCKVVSVVTDRFFIWQLERALVKIPHTDAGEMPSRREFSHKPRP